MRPRKGTKIREKAPDDAVMHMTPWTFQENMAYLYDEHSKGVNCYSKVVLSKYTGRVCIYDGVRVSKKIIISESVDVGQGCSEEHREELKIAEFSDKPGRKLQRPCKE